MIQVLKWILGVLSALLFGGLAVAGLRTFISSRQSLGRFDRKSEALRIKADAAKAGGAALERQAADLRVRLAQAQARRQILLSRWAADHEGQDLAEMVAEFNRGRR